MILNKNDMPVYITSTEDSDSTLKSWTKYELIELIKIAQHNYECANESLFNIRQYAEKLDEALKDAISILSGSGRCPHNCGYPCRETGIEDCLACWTKYFDEIYLMGEEE